MFNIGMFELIVIAALALIFIGPKQLPEVARMVGRLLNELKRTSEEVFGSFSDVRSSARRIMNETEKQITKDLEPPADNFHRGKFPTEMPELNPIAPVLPKPMASEASGGDLQEEPDTQIDAIGEGHEGDGGSAPPRQTETKPDTKKSSLSEDNSEG